MPQYDYEKMLDNIDNQRKGLPPAPVPPVTTPANPELDTLGLNLHRAATSNPVEESKRRKLSGELGVPAAILPPTAQAEEQAFLKNAKAQEIMTKYPGLAKWAQNPNNAAVAGKDMLTLGEIETTARGLPSMADSVLGVGKNLAGSAAAAFPSANAAIWSFVQAAGSILSTNVTKPLADTVGSPDLGEMLRSTAGDFRNRQLGMAKDIGPNLSGMGTIERGVYSGVQSAASTLMLLPLSVATGSPAPILAGLSGITAGTALGEATDKGLPLNEALIHATKQGLIEYGTELFPVGNLLKNLTLKTGLLKTATQFMVREGIGEQAATALQDLDKWATLHPEKPFSDYLAERPEAALETLIATAVGGSIQVGGAKAVARGMGMMQHHSVVELGRAQSAEEHHLAIQQLGAMAASHPLRERDPAAFHEFIETMAEDGNLSDVYVDGKVLSGVFNQSGITEDELRRKMPELVQQLGEAVKTNGEVRISLADYATYVAGTDVEKGLLDHLRASPEGMTYTEAQQFYKGQKDDLTKQAEKLMADTATSEEYRADVQKVHDTILEQMNKAGRFTPEVNAAYAVPFREFYAVNAAKMGMTPSELYKQLPLNFAPMNTGNILNQGDDQVNTPEFKTWFEDSKALDKEGKPLLVYHGTHADITEFKKTKGAHLGFHFGDKEAANTRLEDTADSRIDQAEVKRLNERSEEFFSRLSKFENSLRAKNGEVPPDVIIAGLEAGKDINEILEPYDYKPTSGESATLEKLRKEYKDSQLPIMKTGTGANIGAYFLKTKKPLRMPDVGNWGSVKAVKEALPWHSNARSLGQLVDEMKARGYDSIVYENKVETPVMRTDSYIVFEPEQIKSATGNSGKFNPNDPNILNQSVFHGTPHVWAPEPGFPHGRPRLDKMGTGEGAQAFGWGWYSAESRDVADSYSGNDVGGAPVPAFFEINGVRTVKGTPEQKAADLINSMGLARAKTFAKGMVKDAQKGEDYTKDNGVDWYLKLNAVVDGIKGKKEVKKATGNLFKIDIPDSVLPRLLDWDKPLSEQTPEVRKALEAALLDYQQKRRVSDRYMEDNFSGANGSKIYQELAGQRGLQGTSEYLASIGIVGNRYLDGGSRADGKGTYNYVLWDQATIDKVALLERNGEKLDAMRELAQSPIQTEAFKSWFGDSKVVDKDGRPLVVYHGTPNGGFSTFDPSKSGSRGTYESASLGMYFSPDKQYANTMARSTKETAPTVYPVYLSIKNPLRVFSTELTDTAEVESIRKKAIEGGHDGIVDEYDNYVVFDSKQIKSATGNSGAFDPNNPSILEQNNRAGYNPDTFTISLLKGADLSSTLHEGAHFYLEALADLASRPEAPQQIKDDFRKTLDWFGVDEQSWRGFNLDQKRPYHEQWAQSFERYMIEGKAPTTELQPVFARFRAWMLNVYSSLESFLKQNPLAGKLNDEVRGIFNRLLAAEDSIHAMESVRGYVPLFKDAETAGVTPKQYQDYLDLGEQATQQAIDDLSSRGLRDMKWLSNAKEKVIKELQNETKAKRKVVEDEVRREVMAEPVEVARTFLKTGETTDPETGDLIKAEAGFKLDSNAVAELFPETGPVTLDKAKLRGMTSTDGLSPDLAAQMFGFSSGEALILELSHGESAKAKIEAMTDQRMLERHGELSSEEDIERAAEAAIHNEARAKFMATGLKILMKSAIPASQISKAAKAAAENTIASRKVRDLRPGQYQRAEAAANKEALKLAGKDPQGAVQAQRAALLNNRLAKAAAEATREVEKILRYVGKFQNEGTRKGLDVEYMEQIDDLLRPFDFRKGVSLKQIDKRQSLTDWVSEQEALGFEPAIDPSKLDEAKLKSYKNMTMEELRGFVDSIKQVEHLGRLKKKLLLAKDEREFDAVVLDGVESIEQNANRTVEEKATPTDAIGIMGKWWRQMTADHRKFASIMREMDGGKDNGFMFNYFLKTMNQAGDNETQMKAEATEALAKLFNQIKRDPVTGNLYAKKRMVPGTSLSMTHEQRIMFAMNWGNEGNRQRLLDGGLSGNRALSMPQAEAVLDTLTKEEWDFVQGVWDYIAGYKDQVAALERRLTGIEPQWIEPAAVQTKYGTYKGGYFPVKYDAELSSRSESFEAATDLRMGMKGAFNASATRNGFTKARAEAVINRPILLSYNAVAQHVSEVTHRLSWQEWLVDTNRLLKALDNPIREHYGAEILRTLRDTVVDIATGDAPAKNGTETAINRLRVGSTVVGMGWRVTTALLQPSGLAQSWVRVGGKYMARGVRQFTKSPITSGEFVNGKSKMMTDRGRTMQREINEVLNTIRAGDKVSAFKASYFTMIGKMQRMVDIPTWLGAYEKATEQLNLQDASTADERARIEEQAAALADQAVLDSQSGGQLKDLAKVQRGSPLQKIFTNFYSYFSATYNLNVEAVRRTSFKSPSQVAMLATDMVLLNSVPVLFSVALKELLKGECGDDLECLTKKLGHEQLSFLFGQMVLLREAGVAIDAATGGQGFGYQGPAGLRFFADLYKTGQQINQGEADMAFFKSANQVAGAILHYPAGQVNATMEGIMAIEEGKVEGVDIIKALVVGPPKK